MKTAAYLVLCLASLFGSTSATRAATYYVDFTGGSDSADGTTPATAWQHCPGDANAGGVAGTTPLQPDDKVILKGGVYYRGAIVCEGSGTADHHIVYDGNLRRTSTRSRL